MPASKISAALSDADKAKTLTAIADIKKLLPFLISMSADSRKRSRRMGAKSIEYVNLNLQAAQNFASVIPAGLDITEFAKDVALVNQLIPVRVAVAALLESIEDTLLAAGSDSMATADLVYSYLKTAARNNAGVKALTADIGKRYKSQRAKQVAPASVS